MLSVERKIEIMKLKNFFKNKIIITEIWFNENNNSLTGFWKKNSNYNEKDIMNSVQRWSGYSVNFLYLYVMKVCLNLSVSRVT